MIEYNYILDRDEGDETRVFKPDKIPTELPDLVYIEGPNSSGKSTLLHILALSLHGLKKKKIDPALRNKMNDLMSSKHQRLKFDVKITNKDNSLKIISKKDDSKKPEIVVYEICDGKKTILTPELFERKYNLIYDIPDNPTERLNQLTYAIKDIQQTYGNRVGVLRSYILKVITDIRNSRDPERLDRFRKQLEKGQREYEGLEKEIDYTKKDLDLLEKYTYSKYYYQYLEEYDNVAKKIKSLDIEKGRKGKQIIKRSKEFENLKIATKVSIKIMQGIFHEVTLLLKNLIPKKERHLLEVWEKIDFNEALRDLEFNDYLKEGILTFKSMLLINAKEKEKTLIEAKMYQQLIEFLEHYKTSDIIIPGVEKSIPEFINVLRQANKKNEELLTFSTNVKKTIELLNQLNENRKIVEKDHFPKLRNLKENEPEISNGFSDYNEIQEESSELEKELKKIEEKRASYRMECAKKGINEEEVEGILVKMEEIKELSPYFRYTEEQLMMKIANLNKTFLDNKEEMEKKKHYMRMYKGDIDKLEKKEPHKYQDYLGDLNKLLEKCQYLEQKLLMQYNEYLSSIINKKPQPLKSKDKEQTKYLEEVANFLGKKVGFVRHIDKEYKVRTIDLMEGVITTESGKIIRLTDMGTGQSQSAYLKGLLNATDDRKIIALFDEVAMMDNKSLMPIFEKFKELYKKGQLLVGIVVQMADEVKVVPKT